MIPTTWRALGSTTWRYLAANFLFYLGFMVVVFLYNLYLEDMGLSQTVIGQITSLVGIGLIAGSAISGILIDRLGSRTLLVVATLAMLGAIILRSIVETIPLLMASAFLDGMTLAFFTVASPVMLSGLTSPNQRALAFSLSGAVLYLDSIVGTLIGGAIPVFLQTQFALGVVTSERWTLLLSRVPLLFAALLYATLPDSRAARESSHGKSGEPLSRKWIAIVVVTVLVMIFADSLFLPFLTIYLRRTFSLDVSQIAQLSMLINLITVAAFLLLPRLTRRIGEASLVSGMRLLASPSLLLLLVNAALPLVWFGAMLAQVTQQISWVMIDNLLLNRVPEAQRGRTMSVKETVFGIGVAVALPIAGWMADTFGYAPGIILSVILAMLFGIFVFRWLRTKSSDASTESQLTASGSADFI
jgi:MFS family permease